MHMCWQPFQVSGDHNSIRSTSRCRRAAPFNALPSSGATSFVDALIEGLRQAAREARDLHRGHVDFAELQLEIAIEIDIVNAHMTARTELDS